MENIVCCNLHGACGGKVHERVRVTEYHYVAICTGRVEAKRFSAISFFSSFVAICTGRVEAKTQASSTALSASVAICTGRVEAKAGRVEQTAQESLQSARGVWRQSSHFAGTLQYRQPLQSARGVWRQRYQCSITIKSTSCCNLHGACGGKATAPAVCCPPEGVAICTGRVEAKWIAGFARI